MKVCTLCRKEKPLGEFSRKTGATLQSRCKPCVNAVNREQYLKNRPQILASRKEYHRKHRNRALEYGRRYRAENSERLKQYRKTPQCRASIKKSLHKRRQRMRDNVRDFTAEQWELLKELHGYRCAYCQAEDVELTQDHVVPVSKMGPHTLTNILPSCRSCNSSKGDKDLNVWLESAVQNA